MYINVKNKRQYCYNIEVTRGLFYHKIFSSKCRFGLQFFTLQFTGNPLELSILNLQ